MGQKDGVAIIEIQGRVEFRCVIRTGGQQVGAKDLVRGVIVVVVVVWQLFVVNVVARVAVCAAMVIAISFHVLSAKLIRTGSMLIILRRDSTLRKKFATVALVDPSLLLLLSLHRGVRIASGRHHGGMRETGYYFLGEKNVAA